MSKERYTSGIEDSAATITDVHATASNAASAAVAGALRDGRDDFPIIVHCHLRWDFVWQRPQQIFSRLAKNHRVLFIEDPVIAEGEPHLAIDEPYPNLVRIVPQIPQHLAVNADKDAEIFLPQIKEALRTHPLLAGRFESPVHWFYSPMPAPGYMGQFGAAGVVYDCMDELANFRFAPPDIADRERFVMSNADVVFTGGYQLFDAKSKHHDNVHVYGCGVDVEHYSKARDEKTEIPAAVAAAPGPRFGYFGVIDERLDYELISALADRFPDASIVMAGPLAKVDPNDLPKQANIHWLGQQRYEDLPAIVKGFDVCLMPFALNEATKYINPTKTLEYMAGGKPIVSTAVADVVRNFTPIVDVAYSQDEFLDAVDRAWREPNANLIAQGIERAAGSSWDATVESMRNDVQQAVWSAVPTQAAA
ncbi:glycosyltransferase [Cognatilysobacter terrigena]|uniref:glycosyltransferase n=1 Tax=Cognatilysobacter terrigena TaxID=2488749 RepID=UPI001414F68B|nr:glycosyltransferase [Lysobacter terrigena]